MLSLIQGCDREACDCENSRGVGSGCSMMACSTCTLLMHARLDINECERAQRESLAFDPTTKLSETIQIGALTVSDIAGLNASLNRARKALVAFKQAMKKLYAAKRYQIYQRKQAYQIYTQAKLSAMSVPNQKKKAQYEKQYTEANKLIEDYDKKIKRIDKSIRTVSTRVRSLQKDIKEGTKFLDKEMRKRVFRK